MSAFTNIISRPMANKGIIFGWLFAASIMVVIGLYIAGIQGVGPMAKKETFAKYGRRF